MSEGIEAFRKIFYENDIKDRKDYEENLSVIEHALLELKAIKEAKTSEALKRLAIIGHLEIGFDKDGNPITVKDGKGYSIIKQTLLKSQEQEKENAELKEVLMLIKDKKVDFNVVAISDGHAMYNTKMADRHPNTPFKDFGLTKEEFDIVKRWSEK